MECVEILFLCLGLLLFLEILHVIFSPAHALRLFGFLLRSTLISLRIRGKENIPDSGPVLLVANHVSLIDMVLIQLVSHRPVRFMVQQEVLEIAPWNWVLRWLGVLLVPNGRRPKAMKRFLERSRNELRKGNVLCLFPEGVVSGNGTLMRFKSGASPLLPPEIQVTVIPIRVGMFMGRLVAWYQKRLHWIRPRSIPVPFSLHIGEPLREDLSPFRLRQRISELGAEDERHPQPGETPIHTSFLSMAKRHPFRAIYYDADGGPCRNLEMLTRAAILSAHIRAMDTGSSGYVGVLLPNSVVLAATMHGVLFADRTPAVINFSAGVEVALEASRRAGVTRILTSRRFIDKLGWKATPEMLFLEDLAKKVTPAEKRKTLLRILLTPRRLLARRLAPLSCLNVHRQAVLLFSSGSTGKPKAVMLTHRNINCDLLAFWRVISWNRRTDRLVGNLPLFHAYGFTVQFAFPALSGTPVSYVLNPLDAAGVVKAIHEFKATILTATPTFMQNYIRKATREELASLRLVITGAEKLRPELAARFRELCGLEIIEGYGCTELAPIVTVNLCNSIFDLGKHADHPGSIGIPLPGIHVRVVDPETGVELGADQEGCLQVKGGLVMRGYLNDPRQTAAVIRDGYYDTGDIARINPEGYVYITGRASRFSKIGGEMVPHEGVEHAIAELRGSEEREVAVASRPDPLRGERLIVFYTPNDLDPADIIRRLRAAGLPNLWIPKPEDFTKLDHLPLLGSGKLDLTQLKKLAANRS